MAPFRAETAVVLKSSVIIDLPFVGSNHLDTLKRVIMQLNTKVWMGVKISVGY